MAINLQLHNGKLVGLHGPPPTEDLVLLNPQMYGASKGQRERVQLTHAMSPGDIVCLTSLPRDIMAAHPDRYEIHVTTRWPSLWANNPRIASYSEYPVVNARPIHLDYASPMIYINNVKLHFITAFHRNFTELEQISVPCTQPKGDLYLSEEEKDNRLVDSRYWVLFAGGKLDFTTKLWSDKRWQQLVDSLAAIGITVVQAGTRSGFHSNPTLENVIDLVGKTNLRESLQLIAQADGVISAVSFPMHAAAALDKPCVVIAGGREHWWWEAYANVDGINTFGDACSPVKVPHRYLHTQDQLSCCMGEGCWKDKVVQTKQGSTVCSKPVDDDFGQIIPTCLKMITVDHVIEAVTSYYADKTIEPL